MVSMISMNGIAAQNRLEARSADARDHKTPAKETKMEDYLVASSMDSEESYSFGSDTSNTS